MPYDNFPSKASLKPQPFKAEVSHLELEGFKLLLRVSPIGPKTYENQVTDVKDYTSWGITRKWLEDMKEHWVNNYDWRKTEDRINTFNNYTVDIEHNGFTHHMHFVALLSKKQGAVPLLLSHGWPGSFLEFLGVLDELKKKYSESDLPFNIIVPSLPGYGYSNGPPLDQNFTVENASEVLDKLMIGLGFGDGYIAQGGDIGSFISRVLGTISDSCKAVHINLAIGIFPESDEERKGLKDYEEKGMKRVDDFATLGNAYAREHGTRPATVGLVLSASPIALLAWIGEKFQQWTDKTPSVEEMLDGATLYWFTQSFPRAIYGYRQFFGPVPEFFHPNPKFYCKKPLGYSWHPHGETPPLGQRRDLWHGAVRHILCFKISADNTFNRAELAPVPVPLVAKSGNLVWSREHEAVGHFASWEDPKRFIKDIEDFTKEAWPKATGGKL